jgi:hypothetical protein
MNNLTEIVKQYYTTHGFNAYRSVNKVSQIRNVSRKGQDIGCKGEYISHRVKSPLEIQYIEDNVICTKYITSTSQSDGLTGLTPKSIDNINELKAIEEWNGVGVTPSSNIVIEESYYLYTDFINRYVDKEEYENYFIEGNKITNVIVDITDNEAFVSLTFISENNIKNNLCFKLNLY